MSTLKKDYYFDLPDELIAQVPLAQRDDSRLLVLSKTDGSIGHRHFSDVKSYLKSGDCLILNDSRVIPARLFGTRTTGAVVEFLLLKRVEGDMWESLVKPGRKAKIGDEFSFGNGELKAVVRRHGEEGARIMEFIYDGIFEEILDRLGSMPLPPYIREKLEDKERYQTVYSRVSGSAAAPTAGLHFTNELLDEIRDMGVEIAYVTLHVGLGTFRPVKADDIKDHVMHSEYYEISAENMRRIKGAMDSGNRVISVGTTSARAVESIFARIEVEGSYDYESDLSGWTNIFIYPGYKFRVISGLVTNFHLPESTLIMLISALAGRDRVMAAYKEAVREKYRFFSFGDAMLII